MIENNDSSSTANKIQDKSIYNGYTDSELELLTDPVELNSGKTAWAHWTSELYSFGRLYREWAFFPKRLPLFIYSDHGVHKISAFDQHEVDNDAYYHFTFNKERAIKNATLKNKKVICVPHPWISYRRRNTINKLEDAKGTLVFFSHSNDGLEFEGHDSDDYFEELMSLPVKYHPIVICMHMHDVRKGYYKKLRKYKIPIVTAGNTSSVNFVDEFYSILKKFKYATSNSPGTQMYYCTEMGIPYFLMGKTPKLVSNLSSKNPLGNFSDEDLVYRELINIEKELFVERKDFVSLHQKIYVEWILGLNSNVTRLDASLILWREFFRNWTKWNIMFRPIGVWFLSKLGLLNKTKKIRLWLRGNMK